MRLSGDRYDTNYRLLSVRYSGHITGHYAENAPRRGTDRGVQTMRSTVHTTLRNLLATTLVATFVVGALAQAIGGGIPARAQSASPVPIGTPAATNGDAGDVVALINFQPDTSAVPPGYVKDIGEAFDAERGFGWLRRRSSAATPVAPFAITFATRDREVADLDPRLNTLIHLQPPVVFDEVIWEYALPTGAYAVTVCVGDPAYINSEHRVLVEGEVAIERFIPTESNPFALATVEVTVTDGRLTLEATGGTNTKLNYLIIRRAENAEGTPEASPVSSNATPAGSGTVSPSPETTPSAG